MAMGSCGWCYRSFAGRADKRFCSLNCRVAYYRWRKAFQAVEAAHRQMRQSLAELAAVEKGQAE